MVLKMNITHAPTVTDKRSVDMDAESGRPFRSIPKDRANNAPLLHAVESRQIQHDVAPKVRLREKGRSNLKTSYSNKLQWRRLR